MNWTCILLGHDYDVKKDEKTIFCRRENKDLALAKKGCAWHLVSIMRNRKFDLIRNLFILIIIMMIGISLLREAF